MTKRVPVRQTQGRGSNFQDRWNTAFTGFRVKCTRAWVEWQEMKDKAGEVDSVKIVRDHVCFAKNLQIVIDCKSVQLETIV